MESNWKNARHTLTRIECHSENSKGVYCLQYDDKKIISGLRDNTIKVIYIYIYTRFSISLSIAKECVFMRLYQQLSCVQGCLHSTTHDAITSLHSLLMLVQYT